LHSSLKGGWDGHGGIDEVLPPPTAAVPPTPAAPVDPAAFRPYPFVFGPVTTLQNVAVISCVQNTPVVGAGGVAVRLD
jgi:hypothetical protein